MPMPNLLVSSTSLTFGTVMLGTSTDQTLTLTNTGNADLLVFELASANPLGAPFALVPGQDGCSNQTLTPATSCTVVLRYAPASTGIHNDSFDIPSTDPDAPSVTVNVSGTGDSMPTPKLTVSSTSLAFGTVAVGSSADQTLTLTNTGNADLSVFELASRQFAGGPF